MYLLLHIYFILKKYVVYINDIRLIKITEIFIKIDTNVWYVLSLKSIFLVLNARIYSILKLQSIKCLFDHNYNTECVIERQTKISHELLQKINIGFTFNIKDTFSKRHLLINDNYVLISTEIATNATITCV